MTVEAKCICCGHGEAAFVRLGVRHDAGLAVVRCSDCSLVFLNPLPSERDLARYYESEYRQDYEYVPVDQEFRDGLEEAQARRSRLTPHLSSGSRVLEIGPGAGSFLSLVSASGHEVTAVEPELEARKWIENSVGCSTVADLGVLEQQEQTFNLIVMFHVLEHLRDPIDTLRRTARLLSPGGRLVIEVPNVEDVLVSTYEVADYLDFYFQKAHLAYYSRDTLTQVLQRAGFSPKISHIQRYDLSNHIFWMLRGRPGGHGYFESLLGEADPAYSECLIANGVSDTLWAVATVRDGSKPPVAR